MSLKVYFVIFGSLISQIYFNVVYAACYVNSESHLPHQKERCVTGAAAGYKYCSNSAANPVPNCFIAKGGEKSCYTDFPSQEDVFASCGPSSKNSDLMWTPDQIARRALFASAEVQNSSSGCDSYGQLLKAECNPDFPVLTIYYDPQNRFKVESFVVERDVNLNASTETSPSIKSYLQSKLKIPGGNWSSQSFLLTVFMPTGIDGKQINIIEYVKMMNAISNKYPTLNYRQAYLDFINGEYQNLNYYFASYNIVIKNSLFGAITIINNILLDE